MLSLALLLLVHLWLAEVTIVFPDALPVSRADEHATKVQDTHRKRKNIKKKGGHGSVARWGSPFNTGSLQSSNVIRDCVLPQNGANVCCYALNASTTYLEDVRSQSYERGLGFQKVDTADAIKGKNKNIDRTGCVVSRVYHPSSFENVQMELAYSIQNISTIVGRYEALREAILGDGMVLNSTIWTKRVQERMTTMAFSSGQTDVDEIYLSRFHVKAICDDGHTEEWDEYIEPLTIQARHPFGYEQCPKGFWDEQRTTHKALSMTNVDYVLLQSGLDLQKQRQYANKKEQKYGRNFMLDAGTMYYFI